MLEYAQLRPGRDFDIRRAALYYAQRMVTPPSARRAICHAIAACVNFSNSRDQLPQPTEGDAAAWPSSLAAVRQDGYAMLPPLAPKETVEEIVTFLRTKDVVTRSGERLTIDRLPRDATSVNFPLQTVLECPHVLALANHPLPLHIATGYLGCLPTLSSIGLRWSLPGQGKGEDTQRFHRDTDDWRSLKLFIYLTDVDAGAGPHMFVAGSHRERAPIRSRLYTAEEIERRYGSIALKVITGRAGTSFIADTHGVHAGPIPREQPRLMLMVGYSLLPVFAFRYRPVAVSLRSPSNRYVNRLLTTFQATPQ